MKKKELKKRIEMLEVQLADLEEEVFGDDYTPKEVKKVYNYRVSWTGDSTVPYEQMCRALSFGEIAINETLAEFGYGPIEEIYFDVDYE